MSNFAFVKKRMHMLFRYIIIVIIFSYSSYVHAFDNQKTIESENLLTSESLFSAYGWLYNSKNDKWITKEKEIKGVDQFVNYYILSFSNNAEKYVAIVKEQKDLLFDVYIIDYDIYADNISLWDENTLIKVPILKYKQVKIKKGEKPTVDLLGLNDLSSILIEPRDYFVFQYKFFSDSTVKFLFYVELCSSFDGCLISNLDTKKEYMQLHNHIGKDTLYNNFFYKTTIKYFTNFIDSPLKK